MEELPQQRQQSMNLQQALNSEGVRKRFEDVLGENASAFISSILTTVNANPRLRECTTSSILSAAATAAALHLPITPSLGFAYLIPYGALCQFQLGYKGYVQLALRSGLYKIMHAGPVPEGAIKEIDFVTGEVIRGEIVSDKIVGYLAHIELTTGFSKSLYMTCEEIEEHAKTYSKTFAYDKKYGKRTSVWSVNFNAMARKTVLKLLLSRFGLLSIEPTAMELARSFDQEPVDIIPDNNLTLPFNEISAEELTEGDDPDEEFDDGAGEPIPHDDQPNNDHPNNDDKEGGND